MNDIISKFLTFYVAVFAYVLSFGVVLTTSPLRAQDDAIQYECIPAIRIVADLGYCFGFTVSYFKALGNQDILDAIESRSIDDNIAAVHQQCYATNFSSQKHLGTLAFSSYINLADDTLLHRTGDDCHLLINYYADQNNSTEETSKKPSK